MAIEKWSGPNNVKALRAFLGFTNYYSSFVKNYAAVIATLQDGLKVSEADGKAGSHVKIAWVEIQEQAFKNIKKLLLSELVLQRVNPDKPFVLRCDASSYAVGAALEQLVGEDRAPSVEDVRAKKTVPVAFMSRKLTPAQYK